MDQPRRTEGIQESLQFSKKKIKKSSYRWDVWDNNDWDSYKINTYTPYKQSIEQYQPHQYGHGQFWRQDYTQEKKVIKYNPFDKYSFASSYTYVQPDYIKMKKSLEAEQIRLNALGYPIKISYWDINISCKTPWWLIRVTCNTMKQIGEIRRAIDSLSLLWIHTIDWKDSILFEEAYWYRNKTIRYNSSYFNTNAYSDIDLYNWFRNSKDRDEIEEKQKGMKTWGFLYNRQDNIEYWLKIEKSYCDKIAEQILNKVRLRKPNVIKQENLRKWKRINRKFIWGVSYKPLLSKEIPNTSINKKKVLCVVDCSWSMSAKTSDIFNNTSFCQKEAISFARWLHDTGIFKCDTILVCTDYIKMMWDSYEQPINDWSEWFARLESIMESNDISHKNYDYFFLFTDCNIDWSSVDAVDSIAKWKKHIIFDFYGKEQGVLLSVNQSFNIKHIKQTNDMIEELVRYVD